MDLNNERNSTIFYLKFLKAVMVTQDLKETLRMASELGIDYSSIELLRMLRDVVIPHTQKHSFPKNVAQNLYTYINICRFEHEEEDRKERYDVCNDILGLINGSRGNPPYPIYQSMINSYYSNFIDQLRNHVVYLTDPEVIEGLFSAVVELEYLILFFHSTIIDSEEFIQDISEDLILSVAYLIANDHLLREDPTLLKDSLYLSRLSFILDSNEALLREYNGKPDEECIFELDPADEVVIKDKNFWKLHQKVKNKVIKAKKDS